MPKISVVMSIYKEPIEWIKASIESVLCQTFSDFEFIIVNDNPSGTENTVLLNSYVEKDNRIKIILNEQNQGLTKSLNKALQVAQGDYIARMDADDICFPQRFAKQISFMELHRDCVALGSAARIIDENGKTGRKWNVYEDWHQLQCSILFYSPIVHPTAFFKRIVNGTAIKYDETFKYSQDYALWSSLIKNNVICNIPDVLLYYRLSSGQISSKNQMAQRECAIRIERTIINNMGYSCDDSIIQSLASITKPQKEGDNYDSVLKCVFSFVKSNHNNQFYDRAITGKCLFVCFSNYLAINASLFDGIGQLLSLTSKIRYFNTYSFFSMIYKIYRRRKH